jgi:threonine dehydrogenase-like Zn-dependent dehydrogenase
MHEAKELLSNGKLRLNELITTVAPLEKGLEIFKDLASGKSRDIKVILTV